MSVSRWPSVYSVVLHWKNYDRTRECLTALSRLTYPDHTIVVVDNGSHDGSVERLRDEFPGCRYVLNGENLGFSRGCNAGMRLAYDSGAAYVALVNNDMHVEPASYESAVAAAERDPSVGAVTGKILYVEPRDVIWQAGGHIDAFRVMGVPRGKGEVDRGQYDAEEDTAWASGAMSIFRRAVLERVGFLPEEYFFGQEEWDYSTAIRRAGFRIRYVPGLRSFHHAGASYRGMHPVLNVYNGFRNKQIYAQKFLPALVWPLWRQLFRAYLRWGWPRRVRPFCATEVEVQVQIRAAWLAFERHDVHRAVTRAELDEVTRLLGPTPTWGTSWEPRTIDVMEAQLPN